MNTCIIALLALASFACAKNIDVIPGNTAYGYLSKIGVPAAERIRLAEEKNQRIAGGNYGTPNEFKYQAGIIISIIDVREVGVCGGSLISANRVLTAAHCWYDGWEQAWLLEVVLGSHFLFSGGVRMRTRAVGMHTGWSPQANINDIAVVYLPERVTFSDTISPVFLPTGAELNEDFAGARAVASGYGLTALDASPDGDLKYVTINIISHNVCYDSFPFFVKTTHICTNVNQAAATCQGDSGSPLVVQSHGRPIVVGIAVSTYCFTFMPSVYTRVTSFIDFIQFHL